MRSRSTLQSWRGAWRIARFLLLTYLVLLLLGMVFENYLVYPIPPVGRGNWQPIGLDHEDVWFHSQDGTRLHGWLVPHPNPRRALVYFHGNGEHVADNAELVRLLRHKLDATVFIFDYRGYGRSEGQPNEKGCTADGRAAQRWLAARLGVETSDLLLMGRSLGSAVAIAAASEQGARALILENAFPTMPDVAAHHYPWLPVRWAMKNRYNSISLLSRFDGPVFQSHGTADRVVPFRLGRELFDACPSPQKRFLELAGADHNDPPPARYYDDLRAFLDSTTEAL